MNRLMGQREDPLKRTWGLIGLLLLGAAASAVVVEAGGSAPPASCTGPEPANATICPGDDAFLRADTSRTVVSTCSQPDGSEPKCQYTCTGGFAVNNGVCGGEVAITTVYPSPRGAFNELRAQHLKDIDDVNFVVDPSGNSRLNQLEVDAPFIIGPTGDLECTGCVGNADLAGNPNPDPVKDAAVDAAQIQLRVARFRVPASDPGPSAGTSGSGECPLGYGIQRIVNEPGQGAVAVCAYAACVAGPR